MLQAGGTRFRSAIPDRARPARPVPISMSSIGSTQFRTRAGSAAKMRSSSAMEYVVPVFLLFQLLAQKVPLRVENVEKRTMSSISNVSMSPEKQ
jgi:hypothetical protein